MSLTHTNGLCSGVVTPGLGFLQNNYMIAFDPKPGGPNSIEPGKKRTTGASPCIVYRDGRPFMVVGAPGGTYIIGAVLQAILNVIDHGMTAVEAVSAPRVDCQGDTVYVEAGCPPRCATSLGRAASRCCATRPRTASIPAGLRGCRPSSWTTIAARHRAAATPEATAQRYPRSELESLDSGTLGARPSRCP